MIRISTLFFFGLIFSLCLVIKVGNAGQTDREKIIKEYEAADTNKDGYVDENEYKAFLRKKFDSAHNSRGQKVGKNEVIRRGKEEFAVTGKERDHKISFKEFLNGRLRFFNEADANKDRLLSLEEYTRMKFMDPVK
jgi:DNA-directed RNA polymerase beta subunit